jgi:hypothetical protein
MSRCAEYLEYALDADVHRQIVDRVVHVIQKKLPSHFDAIAFRGLSGAIIAPAVAYRLGVPLLPIRKPEDENSHSDHVVEWGDKHPSYIILDDFISQGKTLRAIMDLIGDDAECRGIVLWNESRNFCSRPPHPDTPDELTGIATETWWYDHDTEYPVFPCLADSETWRGKLNQKKGKK